MNGILLKLLLSSLSICVTDPWVSSADGIIFIDILLQGLLGLVYYIENFLFSLFKLFENKENTFSYENKTKTNFENKENEFIIFNILYINQKIVLYCFPCFRIKSKTRDLVDWDKTKTRYCGYFLLFFPFRLPL